MERKAILLVSFGTVDDRAREAFLMPLEREIGKAFPQWQVHRAYTSAVVVEKLARKGIPACSPEATLEQLRKDGVERVLVVPAFLASGGEYRRLVKRLESWRDLTMAQPLLVEPEDILQLARILSGQYTAGEGEALVFMGHGTEGEGNQCYAQLQIALRDLGLKQAFVALLHGKPELGETLAAICAAGCTSVRLVPLMLTAGSHGTKHMAGDCDDSWKNRCIAAGLKTGWELSGLGQLREVRQMYIRKARKAIGQ